MIDLPSADALQRAVFSADRQNPLADAIGTMRDDIDLRCHTLSQTVSNGVPYEIVSDFCLSLSPVLYQLHYATVSGSIAMPQT